MSKYPPKKAKSGKLGGKGHASGVTLRGEGRRRGAGPGLGVTWGNQSRSIPSTCSSVGRYRELRGPHWAYEGPHGQHHWPEAHPACGGGAQSPIAIRTSGVQPDPSLPPIRPEGYESPGAELLALSNNGHTAVLELPRSLRLRGLPRSFTAEQLHFHWGGAGRSGGAEHILDGHRAAAEMHVVHYDAERYGNASDAQHHSGGLAVLGVLLEVGAAPHPAYANILRHLSSIRFAGQRTSIPPFSIRDLLPSRLDLYYRYNGSLTTPPCFQSVLWTLFQEPVRISQAQLEQLQGTLYSTDASEAEPQLLEGNFRVPQELNQRQVLSSFPRAPEGYSTGAAIAIIIGSLGGCIGLFLSIHLVGKRLRVKRSQEQDIAFKASPHGAP
ncbi:carbonic anhydrase 14 [Melopsittacus undulatus]|uniref:carbonic anhydrase 14 n=1 Tax=Melopsittacus undulatus TaxID=13146 RepID=UPI00146A8FCE|nr:carbonic anhydrase 14 [Melopsittacus undulatus]